MNVVRRETERQVEMRQRSYAWQQKEEEAEPWVDLKRRGLGSREAAALWDSVMQPTGADLPMSLTRQQYLDLLVPGAANLRGACPIGHCPTPCSQGTCFRTVSSCDKPVASGMRADLYPILNPGELPNVPIIKCSAQQSGTVL